MISNINLRLFKCFSALHLPLAPLTLLSGSNASGKSSILQALVLLHQTIREHEWSTRLLLNGKSIQLGTVSDVVDQVFGRRRFEIGIDIDGHSYHWSFLGDRDEMSMSVDQVSVDDQIISSPKTLRYLFPTDIPPSGINLSQKLYSLKYLTAERLGPREVYPLDDPKIESVIGPTGEHAVSILHRNRDAKVISGLALPKTPNTMLRQVEERMNRFFPGCTIDVQQIPKTNAVMLGMRTSQDTDFHRTIHVGFGLTQVFPIIVATLSSSKGDILLIENPEVHLHPAGQALMGQFLAESVKAGIQIIVETHSDHILNGIRRSVYDRQVLSENIEIYYFRSRPSEAAQVENPQIDSKGNIDNWPDGFFDQFDKDMNHFAGWD